MFLDILSVALLYSLVLLGITGVLSVVFLTFLQTIPPLIVLYSLWLVYDWRTAFQGGRAARYCFLSRWSLFKNIRDYFPIKFLATQHLDPNKNYIFGYHPHGMVPVGALVCFATKAAGLEQLYPGIKPRVSMVSFFNWLPGFREMALSMGIISVSRKSLEYALTEKGPGHSAVIMIGGSTETLNTEPSVYNLTLNKRKGFVRLALRTGASLVPVFAFGQNDLFYQPRSIFPPSIEPKITKWIKIIVKFSLLVWHDMLTLGFIPRRTPINVVVGAPIDVKRVSHPTHEQIEELHTVYVTKLTELYEAHKEKNGLNCRLILDRNANKEICSSQDRCK